ncbi:MAG: GNAT family N-acetyltransferase [Myxococcota bacterium]
MDPRYSIVAARPGDVAALSAIELEAAQLLRGHAPDAVLNEVFDETEFRAAQSADRLWVALDGDTPVGFALVELLASDLPHLEEIDVLPSHGRRGIGAALVRAVCAWAARAGFAQVTLTSYRDLPWNMPFYARLGFVEVPVGEVRPEVAAVFRAEGARGFDSERRVVMSRALVSDPRAGRVRLRPTTHADLDFVFALERIPENAEFVGQWSREEHAAAIERPDREHWIIERVPGAQRAGFLIAFDLVARGFGAYLKRIVVDEKSRGLGREALARFLDHARLDLEAPYVWLNVATDNARAQRAYTALGFRVPGVAERAGLERSEAGGDFSEHRLVMRIGLDSA